MIDMIAAHIEYATAKFWLVVSRGLLCGSRVFQHLDKACISPSASCIDRVQDIADEGEGE